MQNKPTATTTNKNKTKSILQLLDKTILEQIAFINIREREKKKESETKINPKRTQDMPYSAYWSFSTHKIA